MEVYIIWNELHFLLLFFFSHWWWSFFLFKSPRCYLRQTWCSHTVTCSAGEGQKVVVKVTLTFLFIFLLLFLGGCRGDHLHLRHLVAVPMTPEVWSWWPFQLHKVKVVVLIWAIPIIINQHYLVNNFTLLSNYTTAWVHNNNHNHTHTPQRQQQKKWPTNSEQFAEHRQKTNKQKLSTILNPDPKREKENHQIWQKQRLQKCARALTHTHTHTHTHTYTHTHTHTHTQLSGKKTRPCDTRKEWKTKDSKKNIIKIQANLHYFNISVQWLTESNIHVFSCHTEVIVPVKD